MLLMLEDPSFERYRPRLKKWSSTCTAIFATVFLVVIITLLVIFSLNIGKNVHIVYIQVTDSPLAVTDEKFLSIALDSSLIADGFNNFNMTDLKILKLLKPLSPAYLRVGGTMADRLVFTENVDSTSNSADSNCSSQCRYSAKPNFTMDARDWLNLNQLAISANLSMLFDLNSLRRFDNGAWNYTNAEELIKFSDIHDLKVDWELGNEPNAYRRQFNFEVNASQLAQDFHVLRKMLSKYHKYVKSVVVGPDVTRPEADRNESMIYLWTFLKNGGGDVIDAVTWHQYYFNGETASVLDFLDFQNFDVLPWQIGTVKATVKSVKFDSKLSIWLGETSSAYGGGAPHLSDRYVAGFLWLDKLGLAALHGLSVVVRQSFFRGYYALVNENYIPNPDWWISVLYKKVVGSKVVNCHKTASRLIRLYCHCTKKDEQRHGNGSFVTVFGINISNHKAKVRFEGILSLDTETFAVDAYVLTTVGRIDSPFIYLNGAQLSLTETNDLPKLQPKKIIVNRYVEMPAYSMAFWVVPATNLPYC